MLYLPAQGSKGGHEVGAGKGTEPPLQCCYSHSYACGLKMGRGRWEVGGTSAGPTPQTCWAAQLNHLSQARNLLMMFTGSK